MLNSSILVSVVVPCFNNWHYLKELIDCFKRQTVSCWELNIVDDGSTDDTPNEILKYIIDFPNIHFYQRDREPKNGDTCRNIGFDISIGEDETYYIHNNLKLLLPFFYYFYVLKY